MTSKRIVYETPDGIVVVTPNHRNRRPDESESDFVSRVWAREKEVARQITRGGRVANKHLTDDTPFVIVDASEIPADREHRDAWRLDGDKIGKDNVKVAAINAARAAQKPR